MINARWRVLAGINASYSFWLSFYFLAFFSGGSFTMRWCSDKTVDYIY